MAETYETIGKDIIEFVECAERTIKPHNKLLYNIIMNALEMMIVRMEDTNEVIGFETSDGSIATTTFRTGDINIASHGMYNENIKECDVPDAVKQSVDSIIDDVLDELEGEK